MILYKITIYLDDNTNITKNVEYDNMYNLRAVVSGFGNNGIWDDHIYYPPHRIIKIVLDEQNN